MYREVQKVFKTLCYDSSRQPRPSDGTNTARDRTFSICKTSLSAIGIMLVFFSRHLPRRVVGFFQALDGGFVSFDVVLVFFVVGLVS
jgi:hypothetical protein